MPFDPATAVLRRKAFALAGHLVGKGEPAYQLLHDLTGMTSISGQDAAFWAALVEQLQQIEHRRDRDAPSCTYRQWRFIQDLRAQLGMDEAHWRNFLKKQLKIDHPRFLTVSKARGAIAALTRMVKQTDRPGAARHPSSSEEGKESKCDSTQL